MVLDIIMYHYVRNNENYYYDCYSRREDEFEAQINLFKKNSEIIDPSDLEKINYYIKNNNVRGFLLTFDDGYKDHFYCAKYLNSNDLKGIFFTPINTIQGELLDVNAIHILIGTRDLIKESILTEIYKECKNNEAQINLNGKIVNIDYYLKNFKNIDLFDSKINQIIKKLLQRDILDVAKRKKICKNVFSKLVGKNFNEEGCNFYLNKKEMLEMKNLGMFFGSHGLNHLWLGHINHKDQYKEIKQSFNYLEKNNLILQNEPHIMCYPFGSFNKETLEILNDLEIDYALTTNVGSVTSKMNSKYELQRWDTNHFWDNEFRKPIIKANNQT